MSLLDVALLALVLGAVALAVRSVIRGRGDCGCGCSSCPHAKGCSKNR